MAIYDRNRQVKDKSTGEEQPSKRFGSPTTPAVLALFARENFLYRHRFVELYRDTYKQKRYYELINLLCRSCSQERYAESGFPESPGSEQREAG